MTLLKYFTFKAAKNHQPAKTMELGGQKAHLKLGFASLQHPVPEPAPVSNLGHPIGHMVGQSSASPATWPARLQLATAQEPGWTFFFVKKGFCLATPTLSPVI